jgi:hypothetical protein
MIDESKILTGADKQAILVLSTHPGFEAIKKLMRILVIEAQEAAFEVEGVYPKRQLVKLNMAKAREEFHNEVLAHIDGFIRDAQGKARQIAQQEAIQDQATIERILLNQ